MHVLLLACCLCVVWVASSSLLTNTYLRSSHPPSPLLASALRPYICGVFPHHLLLLFEGEREGVAPAQNLESNLAALLLVLKKDYYSTNTLLCTLLLMYLLLFVVGVVFVGGIS